MAADCLDYTLRDLHQLGVLSAEDITWFLPDLCVHEGRIVVSRAEYARWFSQQYTYLTEHYFAGAHSQLANSFLLDLIQPYFESGQLTLDDFHQDDAYLLARLQTLTGQPISDLYVT